jgi:hypothetical protein
MSSARRSRQRIGICWKRKGNVQSWDSGAELIAFYNCATRLTAGGPPNGVFSDVLSLRPKFDSLLWLPLLPVDIRAPACLRFAYSRVLR